MRLLTIAILGLALNSFGALIDYRALDPVSFTTNSGIVKDMWGTNAIDGSVTNRNQTRGKVSIAGTNAVISINSTASTFPILALTGTTNLFQITTNGGIITGIGNGDWMSNILFAAEDQVGIPNVASWGGISGGSFFNAVNCSPVTFEGGFAMGRFNTSTNCYIDAEDGSFGGANFSSASGGYIFSLAGSFGGGSLPLSVNSAYNAQFGSVAIGKMDNSRNGFIKAQNGSFAGASLDFAYSAKVFSGSGGFGSGAAMATLFADNASNVFFFANSGLGFLNAQSKSNISLTMDRSIIIGDPPNNYEQSFDTVLGIIGRDSKFSGWTTNGFFSRSNQFVMPLTYGIRGYALTDTNGAGILDWQPGLTSTNGTNIILSIINNNARIGPGTNNWFAKFNVVGGTNVGNGVIFSSSTNMVEFRQRPDGGTFNSAFTNNIYGRETSGGDTNWLQIIAGAAGSSEVSHIRAMATGTANQRLGIYVNDAWIFEPAANAVSGHAAGSLYPTADNTQAIGNGSLRVNNMTIGTGFLQLGVSASSSFPILRVGASDAGIGGDGANSLNFWRPTTGITAAFDRFNNLFIFDLAGNTIGFGTGISNCISFVGGSAINGLVQIGTNSSVAAPATAGIMGGQASGNNFGGSDLKLVGGPSTGTGTNGNVRIQTAEKALASSSALNSSFKDRMFVIADPIILTTNSATIVFNMTLPTALKGLGGTVIAHTEIEDGVDMASRDDTFNFTAVRKGTTVTTAGPSTVLTSTASSGGSAAVTTTWTIVANAQSVDVKVNAVTSGILSSNTTCRVTFIPNSSAVPVVTHP